MRQTIPLTKRNADAARPGKYLWDAKLRGFGLFVHKSGTKSFILKKRTVNNRQTKITIGRFGDLTIDQARKLAVGHANELIKGNDPSQSKRNARDIPRFDDFAKRYLVEHCEVKNKPTTLRSNKSVIEKILIKRFGAMPISKFGHDEVVKLRNSMRHIPYRANRAIALLRHMMNWAEQLGFRPPHTNPCPKGTMFAEKKRNRFLAEDELLRLAKALDAEETQWRRTLPHFAWKLSIVFAIRLLVLTGARLSEILTLKWEDIDLKQRTIWLKDSKTGAKPIYLSDQAVEVLQSIPRSNSNAHVIVGQRTGSCLVNLEKPWRRIRKAAGLPDVRIHDLRHTYASYGMASGLGLPIIGALLGHRSSTTTHRYAHLGNSPARQAAQHIGTQISSSFKGTGGDDDA
jgi:integrase